MFKTPDTLRILVQASSSRPRLLGKIIAFRLGYWFLMALSCALIPDHNPGEDVVRFDLRLESSTNDSCFCLVGQACQGIGWDTSNVTACAISASSSHAFPPIVWKFLLSPLIKWDAARFLNLAVTPTLRDPNSDCLDPTTCDFSDSEQAHAFFPLFPILIRHASLLLYRIIPLALLPHTFESLAAGTGWLLNTSCLLVATLALYHLTHTILPPSTPPSEKRHVATAVCLVYGIWNPASVFFVTNYSESLFGALTLVGHAAVAQRNLIGWLGGVAIWIGASYTRSNGSIHSIWLLQHGLGHLCYFLTDQNRNEGTSFGKTVGRTIMCIVAAVLVFLPVRYHDWQGYDRHCSDKVSMEPTWCHSPSSFSLYGWTQREHWNVGPFHYYSVNQIPNFLLAAPILVLSTLAVVWWIWSSLLDYGQGKIPTSLWLLLVGWPRQALADSVTPLSPVSSSSSSSSSTETHPTELPAHQWLLRNPLLLGHYAILAGLTLVGVVVAHVQISTRLILSSSPAMIWFLTYCHLQTQSTRLRQLVSVYTILFMVLGVILHVNFLPWT